MKAIVTGATGLVGAALVSDLLQRGWEVQCLGRHPRPEALNAATWRMADLLDSAGCAAALKSCGGGDVLFHLGAIMPTHRPEPSDDDFVRANTATSLTLFRAAMAIRIPRVVFASSISVIGRPSVCPITETHPLNPLSPYAVSKLGGELAAEMLRRTAGLSVASLRVTSCYGPGMNTASVLPIFARAALEGRTLTWFGEGTRSQNFVNVRDVVQALIRSADSTATGVFTIGGPESTDMQTLARLMVELTPTTGSTCVASGTPDADDDVRYDIDMNRAAGSLGYVPTVSLRQGLTEYLEHAAGTDRRHSR